jgi:hypothetical protein
MKELPEIKIAIGDNELVRLDTESAQALASIALRNSSTLGQAIAVSVLNNNLIEKQIESGAQLLLKTGRKLNILEYS